MVEDAIEGCVLNSDCEEPLVCAFQRCHEECTTSRDCPARQRCVLTDEDYQVCQLPNESECEDTGDCGGDQQCGVDGECRDTCDAAGDCVEGQVCSYGFCADDDELADDGELPIVPGHEPDGTTGTTDTSTGGSGGTSTTGASTATSTASTGISSATSTTGISTTGTSTTGTSTTGTSTTGSGGTSSNPTCGDGVVDSDEQCDDAGTQNSDGCSNSCEVEPGFTCSGEPSSCLEIDYCAAGAASCHADASCINTPDGYSCECNEGFVGDGVTCESQCAADPSSCSLPVLSVAVDHMHTCALLEGGRVRCWGYGAYGTLGYGNTNSIGDDETPSVAGDVDVGGTVTQISAGGHHTCALLEGGRVRCWGDGTSGVLGYGNINSIGDDETPASAGDVDVGGTVTQISTGDFHMCVLLEGGRVRCWGHGTSGVLGYGNTNSIGDDETPASAGDIDVGGIVTQIAVSDTGSCALLEGGTVRCWGYGNYGALGYGNTNNIGDDETPASAGDIDVGGVVTQIAMGASHTCALLQGGSVRCWGYGNYGALGYGNTTSIGDDETPALAGDVSVGASVTSITCGSDHTCAVLADGGVVCWGMNSYWVLGHASTETVGDDETPDSLDPVDVGDSVEFLAAGYFHTCALTTSANVRCWGDGTSGALGYGNTNTIGDDEPPSSAGPVPLF